MLGVQSVIALDHERADALPSRRLVSGLLEQLAPRRALGLLAVIDEAGRKRERNATRPVFVRPDGHDLTLIGERHDHDEVATFELKELLDDAAVGQGDLLDRHLEPPVMGVDDPPRQPPPRYEALDL